MLKSRQSKWIFGVIAIAVLVILSLVAAPNGEKNNNGSSYGHGPEGYGAWYEYMAQRELPIKRCQSPKPFTECLPDNSQKYTYLKILTGVELNQRSTRLSKTERAWVNEGNTLIILGRDQPATNAPFKSQLAYRDQPLSSRLIEIETTRRRQPQIKETSLLSDHFGVVVWSENIGKGKVIYSITPYLAANAYQDSPDNYFFLAQLAEQNQTQGIYFDEYTHDYKDKKTATKESKNNVLDYLAQTPWYLIFIQLVVILSVAAITAFRRFGKPKVSKTIIADNSTAYIDALAGVLEKANSTDFVVNTISIDEQQKLQKSLGLGKSLVDRDTLIAACKNQKPEIVTELNQLLKISGSPDKISDAQLITWIQRWQKIIHDN